MRKGGRKSTSGDGRGKMIEVIKEFKYLGYTVKENRKQEVYIRERGRKAIIAMREVWGIGKRMWGKDWEFGYSTH